MTKFIPKEIIEIYKKIENSGFEVYFVGGCVRDLILKRNNKDWDLATNATPQDILVIFPDGFYDNKFGTVGIPIEKPEKEVVEITTYRTESGYKDHRRPEKVEWGKTIKEDLSRRDFTINAIALRLTSFVAQDKPLGSEIVAQPQGSEAGNFEIVDPFEGQKDINEKLIRAVGNPKERFKEDALRLVRAIRLATQLSFTIEENTWNEIKQDAQLIKKISAERIHDELLKILASSYPYEGIMLLRNSSLLEHILPELTEGIGVSQSRPGRRHTTDVFTHNIMTLKHCPSENPIVRFAALLHDIGKPKVEARDEEDLVIFHNHELVSTKLARQICDRLKFSKKDRDKIVNLVRWHMFTVDEHITDAAVRRFIRRVGIENVKDIVDLRIGDRLGGGTQTAESWRLKLFKKRVEEQLSPKPFSIEDMAVDGNDVMKELNIKPGKKVGEILQKLFLEVDEDLSRNNKEFFIKRIKELSPDTGD